MIASGLGWPDHGRFCQRDLPLKQDSSQNVTYFVHFILLRYFGPNFLSTYSNSTNLPQSRLLLLLLDLDEWAGFSTSPPVKKKKKKHMKVAYLIIVIFFTLTQFLENRIYTEKRHFFATGNYYYIRLHISLHSCFHTIAQSFASLHMIAYTCIYMKIAPHTAFNYALNTCIAYIAAN